ncbi:unnamed protein product [Coccothraustes coccothraustes]
MMLGASHLSIPARCARRPPPLGLPPSHLSPHPWQSPFLAPMPLESRGAGEAGGGVPEPYLGAKARQERRRRVRSAAAAAGAGTSRDGGGGPEEEEEGKSNNSGNNK